ncbi:response regulator [Paenibacillus humicola]|uniref:response regulator n=1 Tax=Paenibacillus humicola TaxID=3110540 RepID=UPI00237A4F9A|nr:response regulator [Paenibacillus humicola]
MYSILLADDESMELETLTDYVPWETMGIKVAGAAKNGREALDLTRRLDPDIILTDVRMPIMDGLEFAKRAKQLSKRVKIVFLSGHDEFQYIKAALSVEASGYLLKPLDLDELTQLMEKVKAKCEEAKLAERSQEVVREKLLRRLLIEESAARRTELAAKLKLLAGAGLPARGPYRAAFLSVSRSTRDSVRDAAMPAPLERSIADAVHGRLRALGYGGMLIDWESGTFAGLYPDSGGGREIWLQLQKLIADDFPVSLTIGVSRPGDGTADAYGLFREAKASAGHAFYYGHGSLLPAEELPPPQQGEIGIEAHFTALCRTIGHLRADEMEAEIAAFTAQLRELHVHPNLARSAAVRLITAVEHHFQAAFKELQAGSFGSEREIMNRCGTLDEIGEHLSHVCRSLIISLSEKDKDRHLHIARHIQDIIDRKYRDPLTIEDIAKEIYLSPNYIRTIFKEKTGRTILEAVTEKRMERASGLLADKSLKIHDISALVGYENASYFCSVFQKYTGLTPNQFRKQHY